MERNKSFCSCATPIKLYKNHRQYIVPCGRCHICVNRNRSKRTALVKKESKGKTVLFVTLTYRDDVIPYHCFERSTGRFYSVGPMRFNLRTGQAHRTDYSRILPDEGDVLTTLPNPKIFHIKNRFDIGDKVYFPTLHKRDIQLYLKKARYHYAKNFKAKFRYFLCGEYGPQTFRPHYHILFFFDSFEQAENCRQYILECWEYGNVDCSVAKDCSRYVAGYVNSLSRLPEVYTVHTTRAFHLHSIHLGEYLYKSPIKEVYEAPVEDFVRRIDTIRDKTISYMLSGTICHHYFPRVPRYTAFTHEQLYKLYTIFDPRTTDHPMWKSQFISPKQLTDIIYDQLFCSYTRNSAFKQEYKFLYDLYGGHHKILDSEDTIKRFLYNSILVSRKFLRICKQLGKDTYYVFNKITDFWNRYSYLHLIDAYCEMSDPEFDTEDTILYYDDSDYDSVVQRLANHPEVLSAQQSAFDKLSNAVKNKQLNDRLQFNNL